MTKTTSEMAGAIKLPPTTPTPGEIRASRLATGLTQKQAGGLVSVTISSWQKWEYGRHPMPRALYDLFIIKTKKRG